MHDKLTFRIENAVATSTIGTEFDLRAITLALDGADYKPERFPGIVYRIQDPKTTTLIFGSGKVVCTGAKSAAAVREAIYIVVGNLVDAGIEVTKDPEVTVQNMVATIDLKAKLNLMTLAISFGMENVEYNPEQFPGLVYRMDDPKVVALLFSSGKVVCTGAKRKEDITRAVERIQTELSNAGLL